ncbi:MAG TPA: SPOR domain-containing protein [Polyangiaceae bacterium]|nr:SPOR domain-containing protein [Polyangiaceae bacterium]
MNSSPVNLRNIEHIQEGTSGRGSRLGTLLLAACGTGGVLLAAVALRGREGPPRAGTVDQLAVLVAEAEAKQKPGSREVTADELDFPEVLSDADARTTALVAVRDRDGRLAAPELPETVPDGPPPATDQLPVVPLPAGTLLASTSVTTEPKDSLTQVAVAASTLSDSAPLAEAGADGGFSVQVSSFKNQDDAERFVTELRRRGHHAYRIAANVPGRGLWHRVRVGPFKTKYEATVYKKKLEESERLTALVIDPEKVERQEQVRAAKLAERIRKFGSE